MQNHSIKFNNIIKNSKIRDQIVFVFADLCFDQSDHYISHIIPNITIHSNTHTHLLNKYKKMLKSNLHGLIIPVGKNLRTSQKLSASVKDSEGCYKPLQSYMNSEKVLNNSYCVYI